LQGPTRFIKNVLGRESNPKTSLKLKQSLSFSLGFDFPQDMAEVPSFIHRIYKHIRGGQLIT